MVSQWWRRLDDRRSTFIEFEGSLCQTRYDKLMGWLWVLSKGTRGGDTTSSLREVQGSTRVCRVTWGSTSGNSQPRRLFLGLGTPPGGKI